MHLYFIRHGESTSNFGDLITGQQDVPLTENGKAQALAAGRQMVSSGVSIDRIICSSLERAHATAKIIAAEIGFPINNIEVNDLVIERSFGLLEGQRRDSFEDFSDDLIEKSGGELDPHIRIRAQQFLDSLKTSKETVLVVSHTGFGRRLRAVIQNIPTIESDNFKNAELTDLGEI